MNSTTLGLDPPVLPALDNTLGAMLLGTFAGLILEGLLVHQSVRYFRLYPNDSLLLKLWVAILLFLETVNCALNMHMCYWNMVVNYFNPIALNGTPIWSAKLFIITGLCSANGKVWPFSTDDPHVSADIFSNSPASRPRWNAPSQMDFLSDMWLATLGSGLFGCSDLITTSILIHVLRKSRTGIKRTNWTIDVLVRYAFTTGFIITFFQVISIICSSLWPTKLIFWPVTVILTKTAASSMLISLNMRSWLGNTDVTDIDPMSPFTTSIKFQHSQQPTASRTPGFRLGLRGKVTQLQNASSSRDTASSEAIELDVLGASGDVLGKHGCTMSDSDVLDIKHDANVLVKDEESNV
ncbi:hypothetical protein K466DRAFT_666044 [Polyporus arcularius HHB13444]|uniref:DUF6534 domain-containing protein n=1 Tax=Polyporus arcularius HHB13444 TaxID=1314778 RepID=A0A5C3P4C9_9APHY|nr:hypothetical protein K466DRAFT_666044 [Polyporus arcularius HHB13444]